MKKFLIKFVGACVTFAVVVLGIGVVLSLLYWIIWLIGTPYVKLFEFIFK